MDGATWQRRSKKRLEWMDAAVCGANRLECVRRVSASSRLLPASSAALALGFAIRVTCWDNLCVYGMSQRFEWIGPPGNSAKSLDWIGPPGNGAKRLEWMEPQCAKAKALSVKRVRRVPDAF